jgi:hypothetical protein
MREIHNDKLGALLGQRRFPPADPDLAERIILEARRLRRIQQRHLRSATRNNGHARLIVKRENVFATKPKQSSFGNAAGMAFVWFQRFREAMDDRARSLSSSVRCPGPAGSCSSLNRRP